MAIVPFTVHFVLQHELLEQAMFSLDKLSKKNDNNNKASSSQLWSHLLRKRNRELDKINAITCRINNNFNFYHVNVLQSNNESTKKIDLP